VRSADNKRSLFVCCTPGTGKSSFAKILFRFMAAYGLLPSRGRPNFVVKNATSDFKTGGPNAVKLAFREAMGEWAPSAATVHILF
jgi:hypothetical protein